MKTHKYSTNAVTVLLLYPTFCTTHDKRKDTKPKQFNYQTQKESNGKELSISSWSKLKTKPTREYGWMA